MPHIYLDYNASTPIAREVRMAMLPFLSEHYGNPSSQHWAGLPARVAVERARNQVANLLGSSPDEVVFTSGGTEANNYALKGAFFAPGRRGCHIITTQIEHPAILAPCRFLERLGAKVTYVGVDHTGLVDPEEIRRAITPETFLVSVMHANNEVGTLQPIAEIGRITREHGILFHTDAAQSVGKVATRVDDLGVDLLSVAGHKLYAPKGVGALYIRSGVELEPFMHGAGHEQGRRAGTENVLLDVGLGAAAELARDLTRVPQMQALRDRFWDELQAAFGDHVRLNGHPMLRLPNTLNVNFVGKVGADILARMPDVAASTGSACHAGAVELSPVLRAMGVVPEVGMGAIRFSLGRMTTWEDVDTTMSLLQSAVTASQ
ncbi:MAG: cysteine desulfurase family protein [Armatimonadota bacterium]